MSVLYSFITPLVQLMGKEQFLAFYMTGGVISSFASLTYKVLASKPIPSLGAVSPAGRIRPCFIYLNINLSYGFEGHIWLQGRDGNFVCVTGGHFRLSATHVSCTLSTHLVITTQSRGKTSNFPKSLKKILITNKKNVKWIFSKPCCCIIIYTSFLKFRYFPYTPNWGRLHFITRGTHTTPGMVTPLRICN